MTRKGRRFRLAHPNLRASQAPCDNERSSTHSYRTCWVPCIDIQFVRSETKLLLYFM